MPSGELRHGKMYLKRTKIGVQDTLFMQKYEGDSGLFCFKSTDQIVLNLFKGNYFFFNN